MISVVIRNKNEVQSLESILNILHKVYAHDIDEIIVVDNNSTDHSIKVASRFNCKIINIDSFTYGKATNLGISKAKNNLVLLLSAHAVPIGNSFFKNSIQTFESNPSLAGIRYINSYANYLRAIENDFQVKDGLSFGLMTACAMVNKKVWNKFKFDENLVFSEDKEWSDRVLKAGYGILDFNETFFYHVQRNKEGILNRYKNETIAHYQLHQLKYPNVFKILLSFIKTLFWILPINFMGKMVYEMKLLKVKIEINKLLQK
ncbi:Glycosyltransferase, GT2 family [Flavobacterium flevense]|uniref:Glycosyl transferase family 2 n=1 Tax=Flavobacterium flevense TaxID=983 RepID=A0A4Y4B3P6_9FLAO|nr:glycosyltransferase [Flavobacterium flevense]GEC73667.1 glycosyl transferase family 2 [Flavobacterium flevense]SHL99880.1 Glycosyltransferase, GT2 family [Flavobacterium flevense]